MRTRKTLYKIFYGKHYDNLYKGFSGFFFKLAHKNIEKLNYLFDSINKLSANQVILEVGPGRHPHYEYILNKNKILKYLLYEPSVDNINFIKNSYKKKIDKKKFIYLKGLNNIKKNSLDRIILSHVLEHVAQPEKFINSLFKLLKKGGKLNITLPCDPGLLWELGRFYNFFFFWRFKNVTKKEYYYHMSHEHVNGFHNLVNIIKYNFNSYKESFIPFKIKSQNFNLMYNIVVVK
jgi:ubiquinone/menaquinone biosynthesis C-methylase UbiE